MNVLSLFDGMSTGLTALKNIGIDVDVYYSSEIKKEAIEFSESKYPEIVRLGDVNNWKNWDIDWSRIDLVLSGSPCQDLSIAGKRAGLNGSRSNLFFVFIHILERIKQENPNVLFFQENVASATKGDLRTITKELNVQPLRINSSLLTAHLRDRYYWTNIGIKTDWLGENVCDISMPTDRKILFKDIIESGETGLQKSWTLTERYIAGASYKHHNSEEAQIYFKSRIKKAMFPHVIENNKIRTLTKTEMCRLQGFPDNWFDGFSDVTASSLLGDGWTLPVVEHFFKHIK